MREILFRGKRIDNGEWIYGNYIYSKSEDENFILPQEGFNTKVRHDTIGQYTGLTDKNGTKIFEGDILKIYYYGKSKIFGVVKFDESRFFIDDDYMRDDIKAKAPMTEMFSRYEFEVVGNIHDNPELMKGGRK